MGLLCRLGQLVRRLHDLTDLRSDAKRHPETTTEPTEPTELASPVLCQVVCARLPRFDSANRPCALDVLRELSLPRRQMKHVRSTESPESMAKQMLNMLNYHVKIHAFAKT